MYKKLFVACVFFLFCDVACSQVGKTTDYWQWTQEGEHHKSLVKIDVIGKSTSDPKLGPINPVWSGSGTVIEGNMILTAAHVMEDGISFTVTFSDGSKKMATYGISESKADVGVLKCEVPNNIPFLRIAIANPNDDETVEVCGFGLGGPLRHFSGTTRVYSGDVLGVDAYVIPGDSGGCVVNENKEIIGVVSGGIAWSATKKFSENGRNATPTWPTRCGGLEAIKRVSKGS